jgi:hypothetical protein
MFSVFPMFSMIIKGNSLIYSAHGSVMNGSEPVTGMKSARTHLLALVRNKYALKRVGLYGLDRAVLTGTLVWRRLQDLAPAVAVS